MYLNNNESFYYYAYNLSQMMFIINKKASFKFCLNFCAQQEFFKFF